jgi:hypothetical protein
MHAKRLPWYVCLLGGLAVGASVYVVLHYHPARPLAQRCEACQAPATYRVKRAEQTRSTGRVRYYAYAVRRYCRLHYWTRGFTYTEVIAAFVLGFIAWWLLRQWPGPTSIEPPV